MRKLVVVVVSTVFLMFVICGSARTEPANGRSVWLVPLPDFTELFASDAPREEWAKVARHVQVVRFTAGFFKTVPDDVLSKIVEDLKKRHLKIGIQILALNWVGQEPCGKGVEGYGDPGQAKMVVAKLKNAGGNLDVIAMDEPLWFGHYYSGKNCCQSSLSNIAARAAGIVSVYADAFPDVVIGDTEPFPSISSQPHWKADYREWLSQFQHATGRPISFLQLDFNWGTAALSTGPKHAPNSEAIKSLAQEVADVARRNKLQVGMIYTGGRADTDAEWIKQAKQHMNIVEASGINPDQAIIETWTRLPDRSGFRPAKLLPISDPGALGCLVQFYTTQFINR